jgi:hypothetical protein
MTSPLLSVVAFGGFDGFIAVGGVGGQQLQQHEAQRAPLGSGAGLGLVPDRGVDLPQDVIHLSLHAVSFCKAEPHSKLDQSQILDHLMASASSVDHQPAVCA